MLLFLITCSFSFIFFYKSLVLNPLPSWACEMRLLSLWFLKHIWCFAITKPSLNTISSAIFSLSDSIMSSKTTIFSSQIESLDRTPEMLSVLDLPDLVLEAILEKLPPDCLCKMACVCASFRDRCMNFWERHIKNKWAAVAGPAAYREWQRQTAMGKGSIFSTKDKQRGLMGLIRSGFRGNATGDKSGFRPMGPTSTVSWYIALESGKLWFPAQVYNRENGHVGFALSCYDAELCYDSKTNTFHARYPPHGRRPSPTEIGVTWDRIRASRVDTSAHDLHISDCLNELKPGDHVEIQWRRNKEFPYGWWYGVVGHLDTCDRSAIYCRCHESGFVVLEFNQYACGSRWRRTTIDRTSHREEAVGTDGFYGGVVKIRGDGEISAWRRLWPSQVLE